MIKKRMKLKTRSSLLHLLKSTKSKTDEFKINQVKMVSEAVKDKVH